MNIVQRLRLLICDYRGHDWFGESLSEYVASTAICMWCGNFKHTFPWGTCLGGGGHALADHYQVVDGALCVRAITGCEGPT